MDNKNYWEDRMLNIESKTYKQSKALETAIRAEYIIAEKEVQEKIDSFINKYMDKNNLSYSEAIKYLNAAEKESFLKVMEDYKKTINNAELFDDSVKEIINFQFDTVMTKQKITRLESLLSQIDGEIYKKSTKEDLLLTGYIETEYATDYEAVSLGFDKPLQTVLPVGDIRNLMKTPWSGSNFSENLWVNTNKFAEFTHREIVQSFIQGVNAQTLASKIQKKFNSSYSDSIRVARTELNYSLNKATETSYNDNKLKEYEILAKLDNKTSDICREQDGKIYKTKDIKVSVNYPPFHPNCRTTTIPVIN